MAWYDEAVFYHIYPLGLCGCSRENTGVAEQHFDKLRAWAKHAVDIGCNALYIGPLFESVGHGYETTDYKKVDIRLGTNEDFKEFVSYCHDMDMKVIVDGVFNHVGRRFFAFEDLQKNRENSPYRDWFCNVNFGANNEYNDGFSYENWGGYNLLVKLNQRNPAVKDYLFDAIRFWIDEFDIDGIRLDAADVLDFDFMKQMRHETEQMKKDFWLMGEVIHGDYSRWVNDETLHAVTNYELHKGLYSGHNDHNYFEIAHSIRRLNDLCQGRKLYTFVDNHDVERIVSKLNNKEHMKLVTLLLYTLYGIPSVYYGSEFAIEGKKEKGSDWNLRPCLELSDFADALENNPVTRLCAALGRLKQEYRELNDGAYQEIYLNNRQYAYGRVLPDSAMVTVLNSDDAEAVVEFNAPVAAEAATDMLGIAKNVSCQGGRVSVTLSANSGTVILLGSTAVKSDVADDALQGAVVTDRPEEKKDAEEEPKEDKVVEEELKEKTQTVLEDEPGDKAQTAPEGKSEKVSEDKEQRAPEGKSEKETASEDSRVLADVAQKALAEDVKDGADATKKAADAKMSGLCIMVEDMGRMVSFYRDALGFPLEYEQGQVRVCGVKDGVSLAMYGRRDFEKLTCRGYGYGGGVTDHFHVIMMVPERTAVDELYQKTLSMGAQFVREPQDMEWGQRVAYVADPEGNIIEIAAD